MVLAALLIAFAIICYFRPVIAAGLILAFTPSYLVRYEFHGLPTTFLELLLLIFVVIVFSRNLHKIPELKSLGAVNWFTGLFITAGIISTIVSPDTRSALGILKAFIIEPVLFFYTLRLIITTERDLKTPLNMLFISAIAMSVWGIFQYFTFIHLPLRFWGTGNEVERIVSVFEYPNALALFLAPLASFFLAAFLFEEKIFNKKNLILGLLVILTALFLTFSRGAWLAFAITSLIVFGYKYGWKKFLGLAVLICVIFLAVPATRHRLFLSANDQSSSARLDLMSAGLTKIKNSPIIGNGLAGFRTTLTEQHFSGEILNYPHNIFFNFWLEMGILGLISFFGIIFSSAYKTKSRMNWYSVAALSYILAFLIHGLVDVPYFKNDLSVLFWFVISMFYL